MGCSTYTFCPKHMTFLISTSHLKRASVCIIFGFVFTQLFAQQTDGANLTASLPTTADSLIQSPATPDSLPKKRGLIKKVIDYFRDSNKPKPQNKVDFGVLPGPHYSSTTGLGLGIIGTATYTTDAADSTLARSNASVYTDMTTDGYFMVGLRGTHLFPKEKYRFDYKLKLSTFSTQFWGIGFTNGENDSNETDYRLNNINAMGRFMFKLAHNTYLGPFVNYRFFQARSIDPAFEHLWNGQKRKLNIYTAGISFTYDSRDFMLNAKKGVFLQLDQTFSPRFLGNKNYGFSTTEVTFATYGKLWKGAVLAGELHGQFNYGHTPWAVMSAVGSNDRMRGYYEGRYRDQNLIEGQIELRQHIKGRNGIVLWVGMANAFDNFNNMAWRKNLYNAGFGYRWEFKKGINVRIDYGLTPDGGGFIFNINEAF